MSRGRFLVQTLLPDATMPSPHADNQHRRQRQEASETEPALCPVHIGHDGFDLIRKEVREQNANGTPNKTAPASATTNFQNGTLELPAVRNAAALKALSTDHVTRVQLPNRLSAEDVERMRRDFELLATALRDHPTEMRDLLEAHFRKDTTTSRRIAETLGLSEEAFKAQGGGIIWAVVGAAVVCDVFTGCLTGGVPH
jgi:hypothetical protein